MFTFTSIINFLNMSEFHLTILRNIERKAIYMPLVINKLKNQIKWSLQDDTWKIWLFGYFIKKKQKKKTSLKNG